MVGGGQIYDNSIFYMLIFKKNCLLQEIVSTAPPLHRCYVPVQAMFYSYNIDINLRQVMIYMILSNLLSKANQTTETKSLTHK